MPEAPLHVAVGVVRNAAGRILLARRPEHLHQGGLWEFPGGKVEPGESVTRALARELEEELGIRPLRSEPLIRIRHDYPDRTVLLDVWDVDAFEGEPHGREGQPLCWAAPEELHRFRFPAANRPIVRAAQLPDCCLQVTGECADGDELVGRLAVALESGARLILLRSLPAAACARAAIRRLAAAAGARVLADSRSAAERAFDGVHFEVADEPPTLSGPCEWRAAICRSLEELARAVDCRADFAVLDRPAHGQELSEQLEGVPIPVYLAGDLVPDAIRAARCLGAQGVAAPYPLGAV